MSTRAQHVVVVDDEAPAREMVGDYLRLHGFEVTLCDGGTSLRQHLDKQTADLIVLDLNMPEEDGLSIVRWVKQRLSVPIIMLTATASPIDRVVGLELGADDYITKPFSIREFRSRVRAALRRAQLPPAGARSDAIEVEGVRIDLAKRSVEVSGEPVQLTYLEFELLRTLAANPGRVYSRQALLEALWGGSEYRDPRTIDVHVRHLREKVEQDPSEPDLILTVRGAGYRLREP